MATLVGSVSLIANPSLKPTRVVLEFKYNLPNLHFVSPKKGFFRILASAQMSVTIPKGTFKIPSWKCGESTDYKSMELRILDGYKHFESMVELGHKPDYAQGKWLMSDLCQHGKLKEAARVMEKMAMCGVVTKMNCYIHLMNFLCSKGKVGHALQLMKKMEEYGYPTNTSVFNAIVKALSKRGSLNLQVLDKLLRKGFVPNAFTYTVLIETVCREKGVDEATRVLDEIASSGETLNLECYNALLNGLCNEGRTDEAIQLFGELPSKGFHPNTASRNILLGSLCNENRWGEVIAVLDEIGEDRNIGTCNILIGSLMQQGKVDDAYGVINEKWTKKMRPDPQNYVMILDALCKAGKFDAADHCVNEMIFHGYRGTEGTYNAIAGLCRHERVRMALIQIQRFGSIHPLSKLDFYNWVIECLCRKGNAQPAFQLLSEMMRDGFVPNSVTYCSLIRGLCAEGMVGEAMEFVSAMEKYGYKPSVDNFNSLIYGLCQLENTDLSFEVFETMIGKGYKPNEETYITLVEGIAREDEMELAEEVLKELHQKQVLCPDAVERVCLEFAFKIS